MYIKCSIIFSMDGGMGTRHFSMLGLGDIVMPGLLLCFVLRYDNYKKRKLEGESYAPSAPGNLIYRVRYFHCTLIGYFIGEWKEVSNLIHLISVCFYLGLVKLYLESVKGFSLPYIEKRNTSLYNCYFMASNYRFDSYFVRNIKFFHDRCYKKISALHF